MTSEAASPSPSHYDVRFPVGRFRRPPAGEPLPESTLAGAIADIAELPEQLRNAVDGLDDHQLATPYREGGWTVRQLVHHIADSHMNCFLRVRLALTEDAPTIVAYDQDAWAALHDSSAAPIEWSLELIESLHARWVMMLQSLKPSDWARVYIHPENGPQSVELATLLYAWHSRHHLAHVTHLRLAKDW